MISVLEFNDLEKTVNDLLSNAKKRHSIHKEIFGDDDTIEANEKFFDNIEKYSNNEDVILLENEVVNLVNNINKKTLHNLFIIYLIGSTSPDYKDPRKEYASRFKRVSQLIKDDHYVNKKFIDTNYRYLKQSLYNGMDYAKKNFIEK